MSRVTSSWSGSLSAPEDPARQRCLHLRGGDGAPLPGCLRQLLKALEAEKYRGEASALTVEETLHQRARRTGDRESAQRTALNRGIPTIVSPDKAFDDVPQLERIDPTEAAARL